MIFDPEWNRERERLSSEACEVLGRLKKHVIDGVPVELEVTTPDGNVYKVRMQWEAVRVRLNG